MSARPFFQRRPHSEVQGVRISVYHFLPLITLLFTYDHEHWEQVFSLPDFFFFLVGNKWEDGQVFQYILKLNRQAKP